MRNNVGIFREMLTLSQDCVREKFRFMRRVDMNVNQFYMDMCEESPSDIYLVVLFTQTNSLNSIKAYAP